MALIRVSTNGIADDAVTTDKYVEYPPYRNLIINGDMSIAQRGTSSDGSSAYLIDRFKKYTATTGNGAVSQSTDAPSGFEYSQAIVMSGSSSFIQTGQQIELKNIRHALGQQLTLSFYYKSSIDIILRIRTRTDTEDASTLFSSAVAHTETFSSTGTWTRATKTFTLASNTKAISVEFATGSVVSSDNFYLTGVQLEVGTSASDFEFLPYDVNLQRCMRYYQLLINGDDQSFENFTSYNGASIYCSHRFNVTEMRTAPTGITSNNTNDFAFYSESNAHFAPSLTFSNTYEKGSWIYCTMTTSVTHGSALFGKGNASTALCAFDAEL